MIGRFINHDGIATNIPAARFGNISVMPTQIKQPNGYCGESYIIDLHSRTGFSGSPVFVYRTPGTNLDESFKAGTTTLSSGFAHLLGIHWGQFPEDWKNSKGERIEGLSGMTMVIPAKRIIELLNCPKLIGQRAANDQELTEKFKKEGFPPIPENH